MIRRMDHAPAGCRCDRCLAAARVRVAESDPQGARGAALSGELSPDAEGCARRAAIFQQRALEAEEAGNGSQAAWFRKLAQRQIDRGGIAEWKQRQLERAEWEIRR